MNNPQPIKKLIFRGLFFSVIFSACLGALVSEIFHQKEENLRFTEVSNTAVQAYANAIKKDLEVGDLVSVRRTLEPVIELKQFSAFRIQNNSDEQMLLLPYYPTDWFRPKGRIFSVDINDSNGNFMWRLDGFAEEERFRFNRINFVLFVLTVVTVSTFSLLVYSTRTSSMLINDIKAIESDLDYLNEGLLSDQSTKTFTSEVFIIRKDIQNLAKEIQQKKKIEVQLEKNKTEFELARQVAHDIRAPLTAIRMIVNQLDSNGEVQKIIRDASIRLNDIANSLLERTRKNSKQSFELVTAAERIRALLKEKQVNYPLIVWTLKCFKEDTTLVGNLNQILQVLSNLLENSAESIGASGSVMLSVYSDVKNGFFEISDTGKGIPENILPLLFSKGYSYEKPRGNGLGLFTAREYLKNLGGNIEFVSKVGSGTTVKVTLPKSSS